MRRGANIETSVDVGVGICATLCWSDSVLTMKYMKLTTETEEFGQGVQATKEGIK